MVWIGPAALDRPAGLGREGGRGVRGVIDAVFGDPGDQVHGLILLSHQRHFDALLRRLPVAA